MMEVKRSKYDTNPLDPDVARRAEEAWSEDENSPETGEVKGATTRVGPADANETARRNVYSEAPTRTLDSKPPLDSSYPSVFVPPTYAPPANVYQPPQVPYRPPVSQPSARNVAGLGLPEKWAIILPYAPFYVGVVASIIELLLVPRKEVRVRAHAAQGMALQAAIIVINLLFGAVAAITGSNVGGTLFGIAAFVFLFISMIRVWKGETHRIAPLAEPAEWLNKHINPRQ